MERNKCNNNMQFIRLCHFSKITLPLRCVLKPPSNVLIILWNYKDVVLDNQDNYSITKFVKFLIRAKFLNNLWIKSLSRFHQCYLWSLSQNIEKWLHEKLQLPPSLFTCLEHVFISSCFLMRDIKSNQGRSRQDIHVSFAFHNFNG